jgi:hypothetical protein
VILLERQVVLTRHWATFLSRLGPRA